MANGWNDEPTEATKFRMLIEYHGRTEVIYDNQIPEQMIPRILKFADKLEPRRNSEGCNRL